MEVKITGTSDEVKDFLKNEGHRATFVTDCEEHIYDCELDESYSSYPTINISCKVIDVTERGILVEWRGGTEKPCKLHVRTNEATKYPHGTVLYIIAKIVPKYFLQFGCALVAEKIISEF